MAGRRRRRSALTTDPMPLRGVLTEARGSPNTHEGDPMEPLGREGQSRDIVIFGAGGMGREVRQIIERINARGRGGRCVGFLVDEGFSVPSRVDGLPVAIGL